jgi:hypothetical protein
VKRRALLAAAAAALAACAAPTPPATAKRKLTGAEVFAVDPAVLRAAVMTDERIVMQGVAIDLRTIVDGQRYVIRLQQRAAADPRLPAAPKGRSWRVYALGADATATLNTVRQMLVTRGTAAEAVEVTVSAQPGLVPAELLGAVPLRIEMLVDNRDGWFTLGEAILDLRP